MTGVQILSIHAQRGHTKYQAVSRKQPANAETAGQALDANSQLLPCRETSVVIVQPFVEDEFFSESQSARLRELMQRWRECRDTGAPLSAADEAELQTLVETELLAATEPAEALCAELPR